MLEERLIKRSFQLGLAVCGIIGPILFTIVLITLGFLQPGYNHITQYMSELGAVNAPYANIKNTGLFIIGILIVFFSFGIYIELNYNWFIFSFCLRSFLLINRFLPMRPGLH